MAFFRSRFIRILLLAAFVGFQTAQMLHTHKSKAGNSDNQCSVCQVIHHTPGVSAASTSAITTVFAFQSLLCVGGRIVVADRSSDSARPRAPPAA